jgi:hypothetical protein
MGKKMTDLANGLVSIGKAIPLIMGASAGMLLNPHGGSGSPARLLAQGRYEDAWNSALVNYTFYGWEGQFHSDQGLGVKALGVGIVIHKLFGWLVD